MMASHSKSPLDSLIARSKQLTADLMTARHELHRAVSVARPSDIRSIQGRISVAHELASGLSSDLWDLYMGAFDLRRRGSAAPAAKPASQIRLISFDSSEASNEATEP